MEFITDISEFDVPYHWGERVEGGGDPRDEGTAGFKITTSHQVITLGIDNGQSCCEQWGYLMSEDDFDKFIGAILLDIEVTDTNRCGQRLTADFNDDDLDWGGDVMFIDLKTSEGTLQFVAYNSHNGYYGHEAFVRSQQLDLKKVL